MERVIRVLIIDDSAYIRKSLRQMLARSPFIEVVGTARDGADGLEQVERLHPDVVTLDLSMPEMDGLAFLSVQMARQPLPVIVVSIAHEASELVLKALDLGAVDIVQKPTALALDTVFDMASELVAKVKAAGQVRPERLLAAPDPVLSEAIEQIAATRSYQIDAIVIGISTGGPQALRQIIPQLPAQFPIPLVIAMHMPAGYTKMYANTLNEITALQVQEAEHGQALQPGLALIAPSGSYITLRRRSNGTVVAQISPRPEGSLYAPSVDALFQSAAEVYGQRVLGIVMTGMGNDGEHGAAWIKAQNSKML